MSALSAGNSEVFCAGTVDIIKDLMQNSKSEIYSDFSGCEIIYFILDSACPISFFGMYSGGISGSCANIAEDLGLLGVLESVRNIKAVTALWVGCT